MYIYYVDNDHDYTQLADRTLYKNWYGMVLRRCGHPVLACALDARGACCACADQRPEQTIYQIYIDGVGLEAGVRSSFYCTLCRQGLTHTPATPRLVHLDGSANSVTTDAQRRHQEHQRRTLQRVFGTREDVESDTYESPLAAMFSRVDEWARRQEESEPDLTILTNRLENLSQRLARLELHHEDEIYAEEASPVPLDYNMDIVHKVAAERPPPLTSELLHRSQECRVCMCQLADTLLLPCAHLGLCQWCARACLSLRSTHQRHDACPFCRKIVSRTVRVYRP